MKDCSLCPGGSGAPTVVSTQAQADALPDTVTGSLFIANLTNDSITVPSKRILGSLYVSKILVDDTSPHFISFPNLKRVACNVVVGRDSSFADSDGVIHVTGLGSELSVQFPSLKLIGADVVLGIKMDPSSPPKILGMSAINAAKIFVTFSKINHVCGNVVIGTDGNNGIGGNSIQFVSEQTITMQGGFSVEKDVVIGVQNKQGPGNPSRGNSTAGGASQKISIFCKKVGGMIVCGNNGHAFTGNGMSNSVQTIEFPLLVNVGKELVVGYVDTLASPASLYGNDVSFNSTMTISLPVLKKLRSSLVVGADVVHTLPYGNKLDQTSVQDVDLRALVHVRGNLTLGDDGTGTVNANLVSTLAEQRVHLDNLMHVRGHVDVCTNRETPSDGSVISYNLQRLCSIGGHFAYNHNVGMSLDNLGWILSRPLRCIGGPLQMDGSMQPGDELTNIDGLSSLKCISNEKSVTITNNALLNSFCGIYNLSVDPDTEFTIAGNGSNPTKAMIDAAGPCLDAERFEPRGPCFVICCPPNVTVECHKSIDPIFTGTATSKDSCGNVRYLDRKVPGGNGGGGGSGGGGGGDGGGGGNAECVECIVWREWSDTRCCADTCVQKITVVCTCKPRINCPPDLSLPRGSNYEPSLTGTATCECVHQCAACSAAENTETRGGSLEANSCTVSHKDDILSRYECAGNVPRHVQRTWSCADSCGREANCIQNIYFYPSRKEEC